MSHFNKFILKNLNRHLTGKQIEFLRFYRKHLTGYGRGEFSRKLIYYYKDRIYKCMVRIYRIFYPYESELKNIEIDNKNLIKKFLNKLDELEEFEICMFIYNFIEKYIDVPIIWDIIYIKLGAERKYFFTRIYNKKAILAFLREIYKVNSKLCN